MTRAIVLAEPSIEWGYCQESEVEMCLCRCLYKNENKRTRVVELELRVSGDDGRQEAGRGLVCLPVWHDGGSVLELVDVNACV